MGLSFVVRVADPERDAARAAEIYRPYVEETLVSFEDVAPSDQEMALRMRSTLEWTPWLVAVDKAERVIGYAYASRHRERAGYRWSVDISVYVDGGWHRRGVGRALYAELLPILARQGFVNLYAGITLPNPGSVALHESLGMKLIGVYEKVGYKFGQWPDVAWYGMQLAPRTANPPEPVSFASLGKAESR
jgi:phosphinothricin acetyltransferase